MKKIFKQFQNTRFNNIMEIEITRRHPERKKQLQIITVTRDILYTTYHIVYIRQQIY